MCSSADSQVGLRFRLLEEHRKVCQVVLGGPVTPADREKGVKLAQAEVVIFYNVGKSRLPQQKPEPAEVR